MACCDKCGARLLDGARFCERCGAPVGAVSKNGTDGTNAQVGQAPRAASGMGTRRPTRRSPVPIVVGALLIVALLALAALYIVPLFIPHYHDPNEGIALLPPEERDGGERDVSGDAKDDGADMGEDAYSSDATADEEGVLPLAALDTSEPAQFDDFLWFTMDLMGGNTAGTPPAITDLERVKGGWKGYVSNYAIAGNEHSRPSEEILNVYVGGSDGDASLTFAWDRVRDAEGDIHESMSDDMVFTGPWQGGYLEAQGMGVVRMVKFWEEGGRQYAVGRISWPDAGDAAIGLVRP